MFSPLFGKRNVSTFAPNDVNLLKIASDFRYDLWLAPFPSSEAPWLRLWVPYGPFRAPPGAPTDIDGAAARWPQPELPKFRMAL